MRTEEPIRELYDVIILPGVQRPRLVGFKTDEIRTVVWSDPAVLPGAAPENSFAADMVAVVPDKTTGGFFPFSYVIVGYQPAC